MYKNLILTTSGLNSNVAGTIFLKKNFDTSDNIWLNVNDYIEKIDYRFSLFKKKYSFFEKRANDVLGKISNYLDKTYDNIIVTLSSIEMILIARVLIKKYKIKVIIWDDYDYLAKNQNLNKRFFCFLKNDFRAVVDDAWAISIMGSNMINEYNLKSRKCYILRNPSDKINFPEYDLCKKYINIVFCGSLYAKKEWNSLVKALKLNNYKIHGVDIKLHYIGYYPKLSVVKDSNIIHYGYVSEMELSVILKKMHIGYMPYWLSPIYSVPSRVSFPTKLTTYIENGLFIFNHSPSDSEVTKIVDMYNAGISCDSYEADKIIESLERLIKLIYSNSKGNIINLMNEEISSEKIKKSVNFFLNH